MSREQAKAKGAKMQAAGEEQDRYTVRLAPLGFAVVDTATGATTADLLAIDGCPGRIVPVAQGAPGTIMGCYYFARHHAREHADALNAAACQAVSA